MNPKRFFVAGLLALTLLPLAGIALADTNEDVQKARDGTAAYHRLGIAKADGYGLFVDAAGLACIAQPGLGAMGIHYVNGGLVGDTVLDPAKPEALVYEPGLFGQLRLVAAEYIVFKGAWDAEHASPPSLFGTTFDLVPSPNRYGLPAFYALHAWIWRANPAGMFMPWNPRVSCN